MQLVLSVSFCQIREESTGMGSDESWDISLALWIWDLTLEMINKCLVDYTNAEWMGYVDSCKPTLDFLITFASRAMAL